jgi:hypothetical protein
MDDARKILCMMSWGAKRRALRMAGDKYMAPKENEIQNREH